MNTAATQSRNTTQTKQRTARDSRKVDFYALTSLMQTQGMKGRNEGLIMVKNGHSKSNTGYRAIVLSPTGAIRAVQRFTRNGYVPDRGTWQICHHGDLIFHAGRTPKATRLAQMDQKVYVYDDVKGIVEFTDYGSLKAKWDLVPKALSDWLDAYSSKEESTIPAGYGWDGEKSLEETNKESRIRTMLRGVPGEVVEEVIAAAMHSNSQALPTNWKTADPRVPADLENPVEVVIRDGDTEIDRHVIWVLHHAGRRTTVRDPEPTSGNTIKLVGDGGSEIVHANKVRPMPKDVLRAMRISFGAYTKENKSYGVSWKLFARPIAKRAHSPARHNKLDAKSVAAAVAEAMPENHQPVVDATEAATDETFALAP